MGCGQERKRGHSHTLTLVCAPPLTVAATLEAISSCVSRFIIRTALNRNSSATPQGLVSEGVLVNNGVLEIILWCPSWYPLVISIKYCSLQFTINSG